LTGSSRGCTVAFRNPPLYIERKGHNVRRKARAGAPTIVSGINSGDLDSLMPLYESEAAFATEPGSLAPGTPGVREALNGFISMNGELDLEVTRVLEVDDLALVVGVWSFDGTGPDGEPVQLAAKNADVLRRQADGTWRFVIDNPWGTD
jgi:ketosteroid isomerase-like protein